MDIHKVSTQVERLSVVETGRRRRWSGAEKLKIVMESLQSTRAMSSTARRYGISRSLLLKWRHSFRAERDGSESEPSGFVPAMVVTDATPLTPETAARSRMVIVVGRDRRVIVDASVDPVALTRVLDVLGRR
jgi:transposase